MDIVSAIIAFETQQIPNEFELATVVVDNKVTIKDDAIILDTVYPTNWVDYYWYKFARNGYTSAIPSLAGVDTLYAKLPDDSIVSVNRNDAVNRWPPSNWLYMSTSKEFERDSIIAIRNKDEPDFCYVANIISKVE